mmetsp:Transcript_23890/g.58391  ORF Transcript_23890/g.58391 Transcript_23890/m.58391 type:complete len:108 (-) Transcript_23890:736-1059(-)
MLQSALTSPNLEALKMKRLWTTQSSLISLDILRNGVCRPDCSLREILLERLAFTDDDDCHYVEDEDDSSSTEGFDPLLMTQMRPNKSVNTLCLFHSWQPLPQVMKVV